MSDDFTSMKNPRFLYRAELHHPFPDWIANEAIPNQADCEKKASTAFADPARRLLPIHTKVAAFHSALNIFAHTEDFDSDTFDRVKEACAHYGIEADILPYANLFVDEVEKSASDNSFPEGRFAIDTSLNGQAYQLLPINDADDVDSSAFDLAKMAADNRIHLLMFVPAAREIVKAARDFNVKDLPEMITRYGHVRYPDKEKAAALLEGREKFCKDASIRELVAADYQEALAQLDEDPDEAMSKIASIDYTAGVSASYKLSSPVPNAFDICFAGGLDSEAEKAARENILVRDVLVPLGAAQSISALDANFKLGKSAAENFSKIRDGDDARDISLAIESWEEDDQKTFLRLAVAAS